MCSFILPIKILCRHQGTTTEASRKIRAGLVETVHQLILTQNNLTASEKEQLKTLFPLLEKTEPELVKELEKLL